MPQKTNFTLSQTDLIKLYRKALRQGISLDKVEQKTNKLLARLTTTTTMEVNQDKRRIAQLKRRLPRLVRIGAYFLPVLFILAGVLLVGSAVMPIVVYYIKDLPELNAKKLAAPIPQEEVLDVVPLVIAQTETSDASSGAILGEEVEDDYTGPVVLDSQLDYTNLSNWFSDASTMGNDMNLPALASDAVAYEYTLEIPKVNIFNAKVVVGGTDLNHNLIHYPGTAFPGKQGSTVIFGHSVLRQFYNPKETNQRRYNSIFSTIMTLKTGDKIYITYNNVKYTYSVIEKTEVKPTDTYVLAQRYDIRQIKLVTCVPEGTYLRRGVVTGVLVQE